jgi:hypothetical protein
LFECYEMGSVLPVGKEWISVLVGMWRTVKMRSSSISGCRGRLRYLRNEDVNDRLMNVILRDMWVNGLLECDVDWNGSV